MRKVITTKSFFFILLFLQVKFIDSTAQQNIVELYLEKAEYTNYTGEGDDTNHGPSIRVRELGCLHYSSSGIIGTNNGKTGTLTTNHSFAPLTIVGNLFVLQVTTHEERKHDSDVCSANDRSYWWSEGRLSRSDWFEITSTLTINLTTYPQGVFTSLMPIDNITSSSSVVSK